MAEKPTLLHVRIDAELKREMEAQAAYEQMSLTALVTRMAREYLRQEKARE